MKISLSNTSLRAPARLAAAACLALPLLAACGGGSGSSSTLNLGITDGPVDSASSVVVSFTGVELQPSGGGQAITINFSTPKTIDLVQEQNGNEASLLAGVSVPAGNYDWMRLMLNVASDGTVANSYIIISGSTQYPLIIPSGAQTGLKLVQGFTMTANQVADFTIDFMLQQSITAPPGQTSGGTQDYVLRPALRLINNVQAGTISGTVALSTLQSNAACLNGYNGSGPLPNAHVYVFSGTVTPSSSLTPVVEPQITLSSSGSYSYTQPFLLAGGYTLAVACASTSTTGSTTVTFLPAAGTAATVTANQTTTVNF